MSTIPPFDSTRQYAAIQAEISQVVSEVLASGRYINGATVQTFEQEFAQYHGTQECISCNSGTDALYLALRAYDIGPGDEVITSPFTFIATAEMISAVGATPVFVDIDDTFNLDVQQIEAAITDKTRAIMPVHLFGYPVDMTRLMAIAQAHNLPVIEDCAQATGATWNGQKVGSIGQIGCFSFYPTKNLGACGDGGAIATNDPDLAKRMRMIKEHGSYVRYYHDEIGINSRLDAVQAAILSVKLRYLDSWNQQRQAIAQRYTDLLSPVPGLQLPQAPTGGTTVWNQYTIRVLDSTTASTDDQPNLRDRIRQALQEQGVISMIYYPIPLHLQTVYRSLGYAPGSLPNTERMAHQVLSLPMFPELTATEQERVVYALKESLVEKVS
ncbi:MAG: DegT/DnrJ/EryC1/StrS family aminotransferase [Thainema sp.]